MATAPLGGVDLGDGQPHAVEEVTEVRIVEKGMFRACDAGIDRDVDHGRRHLAEQWRERGIALSAWDRTAPDQAGWIESS